MSNPPNILSTYRSHAFYHVLALCDGTQAAEALVENTDAGVWSRQPNQSGDLGKWTPRSVNNSSGAPVGKYSILIHGAADADICIDSYKITAYTAANATAGDKNTSIATEGELHISEPKGIILLDLLARIMTSLQADPASCVVVIKTFFVGHGIEDGAEFSNTIMDVAPIMCLVVDASATYTEAGGTYILQLIALANGVSRLPQFARAADGSTTHLGTEVSGKGVVKQSLDALFDTIRKNYEHHYQCVQAMARKKNIPDPENQYYRVDYRIITDDVYAQPQYYLSDAPAQYKTHGGDCTEAPTIKNKTGASIEDAIHRIMMFCPQVKRDMTIGDADGIKYEYKIHSAVQSEHDGAKKKTIVTYYVKRFQSPRGLNVLKLLGDGEQNKGDTGDMADKLRENIIEFDYIYSGKNIDILEFNIQMNYGLAYLQTAASANNFKDQLEIVASRSRHISVHTDMATRVTEKPVPVPVFFAPQLRGLTVNNTTDPGMSVQAEYTMSKHASIEMAEAAVTIVGNPMLYSSIGLTTQPLSLTRPPTADTETSRSPGTPGDTPTLPFGSFKHWSHMPALAKVNIFMPTHNDDIGLMSGSHIEKDLMPSDYRKKFWYTGYYYVYGVESRFDQGEFTQQLMMVALPNGSLLESGQLKKDTETAVNDLAECYTSKVPVPATPDPATKAPFAPASSAADKVDPSTKQDSDTVTKKAIGDPSKVVGWDKASENVKKAILNASAHSGVDAGLLAQFASKESSFDPLARPKSGKSTATGLYQHIDDTWYGLVQQNKIPGIPANTPMIEALSFRTNPTYSALGGAAYIKDVVAETGSNTAGDVYMGYFLGPWGGGQVIRACDAGKRNISLSEAYGTSAKAQEEARKALAANPFLQGMSVGSIRDWAAQAMAKKVVGGTPLAIAPVPKPDKPQTAVATADPKPKKNPTDVAGSIQGGVTTGGNYADNKKCGSKQVETPPPVASAAPGSKTQDNQKNG